MKSLQELTKMFIIKHGLGRREDLPIDLQIDLQGMEETRQVDMYLVFLVSMQMNIDTNNKPHHVTPITHWNKPFGAVI
jgi:hypothetical protein